MAEEVRLAVEVPCFTVVEPPRSVFRDRRFLLRFWIAVAVALVLAATLAAYGAIDVPFQRTTVVGGLMSSKADFFNDPEVRRILMASGVQVQVTDSGGSINIVREADRYDFVMPSGQMIGDIIEDNERGSNRHSPFASQLVVVAFRDYATALVDAGVAVPQSGDERTAQYFTLKMKDFVDLANPDKNPKNPRKWSDHGLASGNRILAEGPDPCESYSGAAYLGTVAFAVNGGEVPPTEASDIAAEIKPLWEAGGQPESSLGKRFFGPEGRSVAPVAVVYEHQYFAYQIQQKERTGDVDHDRVLLYPDIHHDTVPMLISIKEGGERVGELIDNNPDLHQRALELGFRVLGAGSSSLEDLLKQRGIEAPKDVGVGTEAKLPDRVTLIDLIEKVRGCELKELPG